nr:reverse transcriptase domain-containing protein [Tanacetum cinerariifolium]
MEIVFRISNCTVENQIKFATCTLLRIVLTWWNSHVTTVGLDVAYAMIWTNLRKKMTDKYCLRGDIKKLEASKGSLRIPQEALRTNNNNHGNQGGRDNSPAKVYAVGRAGIDPESNLVTVHLASISISRYLP